MKQVFDSKEVKIKEFVLERMRFHIKNKMERLDFIGVQYNLDSYLEIVSDKMVAHLKVDILSETQKTDIKIPSSFWQHFKMEWFPEFLLKKFPVQYKYLGTQEFKILYPHLKTAFPEEQQYVIVTKFDSWEVEDNIKKDYKKLLV